jgi:hypothetical protein
MTGAEFGGTALSASTASKVLTVNSRSATEPRQRAHVTGLHLLRFPLRDVVAIPAIVDGQAAPSFRLMWEEAFDEAVAALTAAQAAGTATLTFRNSVSMLQTMTTTRPSRRLDGATALVSALGSRVLGATVEASAIDVARYIDQRAIAAIGEALTMASDAPEVSALCGYNDPEEPSWRQLLLKVNAGEPGTEGWRRALAAAGAVTESAIELHPDIAAAIATQVAFELI